MSLRVLVANPDGEQGRRVAEGLARHGFLADRAATGRESLAMLEAHSYEAMVADRDLGDLTAAQLLEQSQHWPSLAMIVISTDGDPQEALRLAKLGLDDYLPATLPLEQLASRLREVIAARRSARSPAGLAGSFLIGQSAAIREVIEIVSLIAPKLSTVLIAGPSGAGKKLAARLIHELSPRWASPMVVVNCGAIPESLLESEFFGHVKGAFTGAVSTRIGRFELAQRSTLFLDEVEEMSCELQAKVLRAIHEREFQRVGSSKTVQVDVRVIAATNCDLRARVRRGKFREDLYHRLNVVPIVMPALVEHMEDLPLLVDHFLQKLCRQEGLTPKRVTPAALDKLMHYGWPGNVRQLENALEKAVVLTGARQELEPGDFLLPAPEDLPSFGSSPQPEMPLPPGGFDLDAFLGHLKRSLLRQALECASSNKKQAADVLQLKRATLSAKLQTAGIRFRPPIDREG